MKLMGLAAGLALTTLTVNTAHADTATGLADFRAGNFAEAFAEWRQAAAAGDARGALFVGVLYDTGLGVPQSDQAAMQWYSQAAQAGSPAGAFNVGIMFDAGRGVAPDPGKAAFWYARAAAKGFSRAEYNLAMMYETGSGVPRSRARAIQFYTQAASHGISAARAHLTALGQPFTGVAHAVGDPALHEFQQAQQLLLARSPAETTRAVELLRRAANQHNALAEYDLGYCYEHGIGVPRDYDQAYALYQRASGHATDDSLRSIAITGASNLQQSQPGQSAPTP
jgi:TPR repeat protein